MADEVVVIEGESTEEPEHSPVDAVTVDTAIDHEGRLAALEERVESFVTRDDMAVVASTISATNESIADVADEVQEVREEMAEEALEDIQEEIEEAQEPIPEPEPEPEPEPDNPPESKRTHRWWRTRGE